MSAFYAIKEFTELHGGPPVRASDHRTGTVLLLADGARIVGGSCHEAPYGREGVRRRRMYHATLLERVESDCAKLEAALRCTGGAMTATPWEFPRDWAREHYLPLPKCETRDACGQPSGEAVLTHLRSIAERELKAVAELDVQLSAYQTNFASC